MKKTKIQMVDIGRLQLNRGQIKWLPRNPRQWTQADIDKMARSLERDPDFVEERPVLATPGKGDALVVFAHNLLTESASRAGHATLPAVIYTPENEEDRETIRRRALLDNGAMGRNDPDILANEWPYEMEELAEFGYPDFETDAEEEDDTPMQEDNFSEETEEIETRTKAGEIWQLGDHRLMCGDSTDAVAVSKLMDGNQADLLLTDPPYNVDYSSKNEALTLYDKANRIQDPIKNDKMSDAEFATFLDGAFGCAAKVLKPGGAFYVWTAQGHAQTDIAKALDRAGLFFRQQIIWVKNSLVLGRMDYQWKHEPCYYGWKEGTGHYFRDTRSETTVIPDASEIDLKKMKKEEMRDLLERIYSEQVETSIIHEDKPMRSDLHPTMKPVRLIGRLMRNSSRENENVLDLFGGSGTTLIAAEQLGRKCYMMELDPHYCDVILARWEKLTGQTARKLE